MRLTKNRQLLLNELKRGGAFSAQKLHDRLPDMDLATIYRNLKLFVDEGIVQEIHVKKDEAMYEFADDQHQHAICTDCGKVLHVDVDTEQLKKTMSIKNFEINNIEIAIKGHCTN